MSSVALERFQPRALSRFTVGSIANARKKQIATVIMRSVSRDATYQAQMLRAMAKIAYQIPLTYQRGRRDCSPASSGPGTVRRSSTILNGKACEGRSPLGSSDQGLGVAEPSPDCTVTLSGMNVLTRMGSGIGVSPKVSSDP